MGLPVVEAEALAYRFVEGFNDAKAPYYGVNIIEVNSENWDAFVEMSKVAHMAVTHQYGGYSYLWTERDYGNRKRVLWVNYYPENIGHFHTHEMYASEQVRSYWHKYSALVERWDWFIACGALRVRRFRRCFVVTYLVVIYLVVK